MIQLGRDHELAIRRHGEETYPHECCGFVFGREDDGVKVAVHLRPAANTRDDSPQNRYLIQPEEFQQAEREAEGAGLVIVGIYHSHPDHPARPSQFDRDHAWPWFSYLIVSVQAGTAADLTSWEVVDPDAFFEPEPYLVIES